MAGSTATKLADAMADELLAEGAADPETAARVGYVVVPADARFYWARNAADRKAQGWYVGGDKVG